MQIRKFFSYIFSQKVKFSEKHHILLSFSSLLSMNHHILRCKYSNKITFSLYFPLEYHISPMIMVVAIGANP